jgi:hypothetical protein
VLGPAAEPIKAFADDMAAKFGLVKKETIDTASGFAALGKGVGNLSGQALTDFTTKFTKLAGDLSSNQNLGFDEAAASLMTQLIGNQSDALLRLGVVTTEETLKQYAYSHAIAKTGSELTAQQKLEARMGIIGEKLAFVNGDLEKTFGGVANQVRGLGGRLTNFAAEAGKTIEPITQVLLGFAGTALEKVAPMVIEAGSFISGAFIDILNTVQPGLEAIGERLLAFPGLVSDALGPGTLGFLSAFGAALKADVLNALDLVGVAWRNLPDFVDIAAIKINEIITNMGAYIAVLPENLGIIANYISNNWRQLITDGVNAVIAIFKNLGTNIGELANSVWQFLQDPTQGFQVNWTPLLDGFKATAAQLPELMAPELVSFQDQIDAKIQEIGDREAARADDMAASAAEKVAPAAAAKVAETTPAEAIAGKGKGKEKLLAGALELGSAEARSADLAFRAGGGGDPMKDVAKTGRDSLAEQRRQTSLLDKIAKKDPGQGVKV